MYIFFPKIVRFVYVKLQLFKVVLKITNSDLLVLQLMNRRTSLTCKNMILGNRTFNTHCHYLLYLPQNFSYILIIYLNKSSCVFCLKNILAKVT